MSQPVILPSLLSAPFDRLGESVAVLERAGCRLLHYDVMDGHFVPNITIGPLIIQSLQGRVESLFDVHLMVTNPRVQAAWFNLPSVRSITFHIEAAEDAAGDIDEIRQRDKKVGISLNPDARVERLDGVLESVDQVLVMSVFPGFGGQSFIPESLKRVEYFAERKRKENLNYVIQIDGGVKPDNLQSILDAGAEEIVAGSSIFHADDPAKVFGDMMGMCL